MKRGKGWRGAEIDKERMRERERWSEIEKERERKRERKGERERKERVKREKGESKEREKTCFKRNYPYFLTDHTYRDICHKDLEDASANTSHVVVEFETMLRGFGVYWGHHNGMIQPRKHVITCKRKK